MEEGEISDLNKELSGFFEENDVLGIKVRSFNLLVSGKNYPFGLIMPDLQGRKFGYGDYDYVSELRNIGKKHGLEYLIFSLDCYGK